MTATFRINPENPESKDTLDLLEELSKKLHSITGNNGKTSFDLSDVRLPRSLFVIARSDKNEAVGCGAIRPVSKEIAEVKRMFAKPNTQGVGTAILNYLETAVIKFGFNQLRLETRSVNQYAVNFYLKLGFKPIPNYGKYVDKPDAVCFAKNLIN